MLFKLNLGQRPSVRDTSKHWLQAIKTVANHAPDSATITGTRRLLAKILIAMLVLSCIERLSNDIQEVAPDHESNICSYWNYYWNCNHTHTNTIGDAETTLEVDLDTDTDTNPGGGGADMSQSHPHPESSLFQSIPLPLPLLRRSQFDFVMGPQNLQ